MARVTNITAGGISLKKLRAWFMALSLRERVVVGAAGIAIAGYLAMLPVDFIREYLVDNERLIDVRKRDLAQLNDIASQHRRLDARIKSLQKTFAESQMSFEEVTSKLDGIIKQNIGNDNYDLKKTRPASDINEEYQKQEFSLKIRSITLEQLIKLMHGVERSAGPLFLSKLDVTALADGKEFTANFEIFSIRRSKPTTA